MRVTPGQLMLLAMVIIIMGAVMRAHEAPAQQVDQEPDVPKRAGTCALYHTHTHSNGGQSFQLTCSVPIPDSVVVYPKRSR